jgi:hypothetical protein
LWSKYGGPEGIDIVYNVNPLAQNNGLYNPLSVDDNKSYTNLVFRIAAPFCVNV